jgi:hypothetical protein
MGPLSLGRSRKRSRPRWHRQPLPDGVRRRGAHQLPHPVRSAGAAARLDSDALVFTLYGGVPNDVATVVEPAWCQVNAQTAVYLAQTGRRIAERLSTVTAGWNN